LTGTELFSHFELTELNVLADATQKIYLDLPSLFEWLDAEWEKRRAKVAAKRAGE